LKFAPSPTLNYSAASGASSATSAMVTGNAISVPEWAPHGLGLNPSIAGYDNSLEGNEYAFTPSGMEYFDLNFNSAKPNGFVSECENISRCRRHGSISSQSLHYGLSPNILPNEQYPMVVNCNKQDHQQMARPQINSEYAATPQPSQPQPTEALQVSTPITPNQPFHQHIPEGTSAPLIQASQLINSEEQRHYPQVGRIALSPRPAPPSFILWYPELPKLLWPGIFEILSREDESPSPQQLKELWWRAFAELSPKDESKCKHIHGAWLAARRYHNDVAFSQNSVTLSTDGDIARTTAIVLEECLGRTSNNQAGTSLHRIREILEVMRSSLDFKIGGFVWTCFCQVTIVSFSNGSPILQISY